MAQNLEQKQFDQTINPRSTGQAVWERDTLAEGFSGDQCPIVQS